MPPNPENSEILSIQKWNPELGTFQYFAGKSSPIKRLFANISLVVVLNLLVKPVWVLMEMELQDQIGHEAWGLYAALLSLGYLLLTFADLGINQYATKTLASQPEMLRTHFPVLFSAKILLTLLYPFLMILVGWALGYREEALYLLFLLCLVQGGNQLAQFFRANFQALQQFNIDAWLSVAERIVLIGLTLGLFWLGLSLERFVMARLLAVVFTSCCFTSCWPGIMGCFGQNGNSRKSGTW